MFLTENSDSLEMEMAELNNSGWTKEVLERLVRIESKSDDMVMRQDKANGRTSKNEDMLRLLGEWRASMVESHLLVLQNSQNVQTRLANLERWKSELGGGYNWAVRVLIVLNSIAVILYALWRMKVI